MCFNELSQKSWAIFNTRRSLLVEVRFTCWDKQTETSPVLNEHSYLFQYNTWDTCKSSGPLNNRISVISAEAIYSLHYITAIDSRTTVHAFMHFLTGCSTLFTRPAGIP